jgi:integrase
MITPDNPKASRDWGIIKKKGKDGKEHWYARIIRYEGDGKKKQYVAKADNKSHARRLRDELEEKYSQRGARAIEGDKVTFRKLAEIYRTRKLIPAEYHTSNNGAVRKVAGLRSVAPVLNYLKVLTDHFGAFRLREISHSDIEDFKHARLQTPSKRGDRSIADVNRTLALLRSMLRFAVQNGWILRSPFEHGAPLISVADETKRERTLSFEEENRLLSACVESREVVYERNGKTIRANVTRGRELLKAIVITALDTAMRKGELLKIRWRDVDLQQRIISVTALNSKTAKARTIGMTERVHFELHRLWEISLKEPDSLVFGVSDVKRSFAAACREAEVSGLHFHDLRHTAITRMVNSGLPPMEIMKVSGHTQWTTFARYVNPSTETVKHIARTLSTYVDNSGVSNTSDNDFIN